MSCFTWTLFQSYETSDMTGSTGNEVNSYCNLAYHHISSNYVYCVLNSLKNTFFPISHLCNFLLENPKTRKKQKKKSEIQVSQYCRILQCVLQVCWN